MLPNAGYINTFGQTNWLTVLGFQASIFGHIIPSQLQSLSLYPLQEGIITSDILTQAGYLTSDCILRALGHQMNDYSQVIVQQLLAARYFYSGSTILTPVGLVAMHTGFLSKNIYKRHSIFPFGASIQAQSTD